MLESCNNNPKSTASDKEAVEATIQDYFLGLYHRDIEKLREAFHPNARLFGHLDGAFIEMSLNEWLAKVQSRPVPSASGENFDMGIVSVEVIGQVAAAKVLDLYRGLRFTDLLHLARLDTGWVIVNKTFHHD